MSRLRRSAFTPLLLFLTFFTTIRPLGAYSVLTHEEIIDLTWADSIKPLLLKRFPTLTPAQLREAHAYAYGGCVIQDLGYYPFGKPLFSDLLHYVRTGDFIRALFRNSKNANDVAFAIGALSHYLGDTIGHPQAVNLAVGKEFPELAAKYGPNVNYAEGEHQHVRAEFAFDINDIAKHRLAPEKYLNHIGFVVPAPLLARAFYETYGLDLTDILGNHRPALKGYRFSVRTLLPRVAYAETLLYRKRLPPDAASPALDQLNQQVASLAAADHWSSYRRHAGVGTYLLAGVLFVTPKIGPLSDLALRGPTPAAEQDYVDSLVHTAETLRQTLARATTSDGIPNKDLDTGGGIFPGNYRLADLTYADLLHRVTRDSSTPIPYGIKRDLLAFFSDPDKAVYLKRNRQKFARMQSDLPVLRTISTRAAYPSTAFLPEPAADLAPNPEPEPRTPGSTTPPPAPGAASKETLPARAGPTPSSAPAPGLPALDPRT
jgi:hypothetical protein